MMELHYEGDIMQAGEFNEHEEMCINIKSEGRNEEFMYLCKEQIEILRDYFTEQLNK